MSSSLLGNRLRGESDDAIVGLQNFPVTPVRKGRSTERSEKIGSRVLSYVTRNEQLFCFRLADATSFTWTECESRPGSLATHSSISNCGVFGSIEASISRRLSLSLSLFACFKTHTRSLAGKTSGWNAWLNSTRDIRRLYPLLIEAIRTDEAIWETVRFLCEIPCGCGSCFARGQRPDSQSETRSRGVLRSRTFPFELSESFR